MKTKIKGPLPALAIVFIQFLGLIQAGRVTDITPTSGSLLGATRLTIRGYGFAQDQFNQFQNELGNNVSLVSFSPAHVVPCDVIPYYTTPSQIVCTTRPSPTGEDIYNIRVAVDGKWLHSSDRGAYCGSECVYKFTKAMTPTITSITPRYGLPGTLLTLRGRIITDQVMETEGSDPSTPFLDRVYAGTSLCDMKNPETQKLYGVKVDNQEAQTGYIKCKPVSTVIGSQRASFLVSGPYGRSQMSKYAISVDSRDKLYLFQTHADISDVNPSSGSFAGGTVLNIKGKGFGRRAENVTVQVAGVPCEILSLQNDTITCQTGEAPPFLSENVDVYPGSRGLLREIWKNTRPPTVSAVWGLNTSAEDYRSELIAEATSPTQSSFGEYASFSERIRGFFVPPSDNNYTFYIQADDQAELYFSLNESASAKAKIASCYKPTTSWTAFREQKSTMFSLKKGKRYYIEALHVQDGGDRHLKIGVKLQKTRHVNSQIGSAINEKQEISMTSVQRPEVQVINITSWDDGKQFEVQEIEVVSCSQSEGDSSCPCVICSSNSARYCLDNATNCSDAFSINYGGITIPRMTLNNMTAGNLQCALNNLTDIRNEGFVNVTEVKTAFNGSTFRITFYFNNPDRTKMLQTNSQTSNMTTNVTITRLQKGIPGNYWFKLSMGGRTSNKIHIEASENDIKQQLQNMTLWYCNYGTPSERAYYYNGFERPAQDPERGEKVDKPSPYCGRFSLKNPFGGNLFYSGKTKDLSGRTLSGYDVARYTQLCFAYRGRIKNTISFLISYTDKSGRDKQSSRSYEFVPILDDKWHWLCMNVYDKVLNDRQLSSSADERFKMYVERINVGRDSGSDLFIDDLYIWRDAVSVHRMLPAAEPGGNIIQSINVQKLGRSVWSVSLTPASCETGIDLFQIAGAEVVSGNASSDEAMFQPINGSENTKILISREQAASPPIGGVFDLHLENEKIKDIPASVSAYELKSILESNFNIGKVNVSKEGTCAEAKWTVEWATTGGDQPALEVNGTGLTGNMVSVKARTISNGGLFLRPIPGDMLRVAETKPQVTVLVDSIPSSCVGRSCSFTFSSSATPSLALVSPLKGSSGTEITLSGSHFSVNVSEVNVVIGGSVCQVTSSNLTTIKCTAGQSSGGSHEIIVKIRNKGFAKPLSRNVTYTYKVNVSGIHPNQGSVGGGTLVAIRGDGFGETSSDTQVTVGGSICKVGNVSLTEIFCITSPHGAGHTSIDVMVRGEIGSLKNAFVYESNLSPSISSLSISEGRVSGGEELVIKGTGFGVSKPSIDIGSNLCDVRLHSDSLIKCTTPANPPGLYDVLLFVDSKGYAVLADSASSTRLPQFKYVLEVTDISPRIGSIFGGAFVTVTGHGFSDNTSEVTVNMGHVPCHVLSSTSSKIVCETDASSKVYKVDNSGSHPEFGVGYSWNPQTVVINVGDFVQWKWTSAELTGLTFGVHQTRDSISTVYDGEGFKSSFSGNGAFKTQFNVAGTYFYSSGPVDPDGVINMKGRVIVNDLKTDAFDVKVQVGGFTAPYNKSDNSQSHSSSSDCLSGVTSGITSCAGADLLPSNQSFFRFTFGKCSTPKVTSISPNRGKNSTILTINGVGFGNENCFNEVKIGSHDCAVQNSSENEITCLVTTAERQLEAGIPHPVSVRINNRGFAFIAIEQNVNSTFTLQPSIQSIFPRTGSLMGGSLVTIKGNGFTSESKQTVVYIGAGLCKIVAISYSEIQCQTSAWDASQALPVVVKVNALKSSCESAVGCSFSYSFAVTPKVDSVTPSVIVGSDIIIGIYGSGLPSDKSDLHIKIGNTSCTVTSASQYSASCRVGPIVAGNHKLEIRVAGQGFAMFEAGASTIIVSSAVVYGITPTEGSIMGGTVLSINGSGFDPADGQTVVKIGANNCPVIKVTSSEVICRTSAHQTGSFEVVVKANNIQFPRLRYAYRTFTTPYVTSVSPSRGKGGQIIAISGSGFSSNPANMHVTIANNMCNILNSSEHSLNCKLENEPAGVFDVILHVKGKGLAAYPTDTPVTFEHEMSFDSISPNISGFGGGRIISIKGQGFSSLAVIKICGNPCGTINSSFSEVYCEVPAYTGTKDNPDVPCYVSVEQNFKLFSFNGGLFTYQESLTSRIASVSPLRGGTGGGVEITITGNGFSSKQGGNKVTIAGIPCKITSFSQTEIRCVTGPIRGTTKTKVRVEVENLGFATQDHADFWYIDVWSSPYTWGYKNPPGKGEGVQILKGQTILLDEDTPVLTILVIRGELIFEEKDVTLNAEKILIVDGGRLQVGTETKPFQHKAKIVLHGDIHDKLLPIFGTKVLAVRQGTLDLHGKVVPITWTHLTQTAVPGDNQLILKQAVTWSVGDQIVLASTSRSPAQNEEFTITSVSDDGRTLGVTPSVKYKHISIVQNIAGRRIETRAEVGLLTRNVVVEGSEEDGYSKNIPECSEGFDPGMFAVQTCFRGRYGEEKESGQFGAQIMINARRKSMGLVTGRLSYIEVRKAGQAFSLGRYPIHFHLSGNVSESYVRGCAIHHTFNRAVTVHGVTGLIVEHNVAYHVMGHGYFIEDGIETGNTIQFNLGVFVQTSSTLLHTDVTPATFWVTNPNNTIRHNAAAGGTHHGYWYNIPIHPGGPSFTPSVCSQYAPLGEFQNNSAHSFGGYGVWIFKDYFPRRGGGCGSRISAPAKFHTLLAYNNLKGFELTNGGAIQTINFTVIDNSEAGLEFTKVAGPWGYDGPLVKDCLVVGHSAISENPSACTMGGLVAPMSSRLTVSNTTFVNFDAGSCAVFRACSFCRERAGGYTTRFEKLRFINSPNKVGFKWEHEAVLLDLDGTLTGFPGGSILPSNPNLPSEHCYESPHASRGAVPGSVCNGSLRFRRMSWNNARPSSLQYKDVLLTNKAGTSYIPWKFMRITHSKGWMATVIMGQNYTFQFRGAPPFTNISYRAGFYEFGDQDFVWMTHPMRQEPDRVSTGRSYVGMSSHIPLAENASSGDWYYNNVSKELTYIVSGRGSRELVDQNVDLNAYRCYFKDCIKPIPPPPPEERPNEFLQWSDPESWYGTVPGYGGYNKRLPQDGDDVIIKQHWWMVADTVLPSMGKLIIYGTLELEPRMDFVLNATYIFVATGGNLIIGWKNQPMAGKVSINLRGNWYTPDVPVKDGPNVAAKSLSVFGNLQMHGLNRSVYWTRLRKTADQGSSIIQLEEAVDWRSGEEIVVGPTSFEPYDAEIFSILDIFQDRRTLRLNGTLKHRHLVEKNSTRNWNYSLAAEVGLLTRNIVIAGSDDADGVLEKQSFGGHVLFGASVGTDSSSRVIRVENVEFRYCGQLGFTGNGKKGGRYSLAIMDAGNLESSSVRGNSFRDGFNTALGVYGSNGLTVADNVIYHTVGSSVIISGKKHKLVHNLAVLSVSEATYKGRQEDNNKLWHASFDVTGAPKIVFENNAASGSERVGFKIRGKSCYQEDPDESWDGNVGHTTLHGIHIGYGDGLPGCLKIENFLLWKSWDYGVFAFPSSRVIVKNTIVADNTIGVHINIWGPPALSHQTADKFVHIDQVLFVGTSPSFDCSDLTAPRNSYITLNMRAPRCWGDGNTGLLLSTFTSAPGLAPLFAWHNLDINPAIRGVVRLTHVEFAHFGTKCGRSSVAITSNPSSPDVFHPVYTKGISLYNVDNDRLFHIPPSNIGWINPGDCVDMDCDGHKHVLIKDEDGSLIGVSGGSVIAKAEFEWNGDPRRGLGDYRIPKQMFPTGVGNASVVAPHHGIVRGTRTQNFCSWNAAWNANKCSTLDYHMFVIESLDADTELRRLSPVAVSANGYTDLLNGPGDHGCCFGYHCMERISTFFSVVAVENNYTLYFTGTNPQNLRLTLLNADTSQAVRVAIWYNTRRLDVYRAGIYVYPTNARLDLKHFAYKQKDASLPDNQFEPPLSSISGANYYDRDSQLLYVVVKGNVAVDIKTAPVIQVKIGARPVHFNDFFENNLIQNLVAILNIDESRIRVVEIVNARGKSRRRRDSDDKPMTITIEIGDAPSPHIPYTPEEKYNPGNLSSTTSSPVTMATTALPTPSPDEQYIDLSSLATRTVQAAQTGQMSSSLNLDISSVEVTDPEPPRKLPKGWKRATPETAGPKNGTVRFDQEEAMKEGNKSNPIHDYLIPQRLTVIQEPFGANETVPFLMQPKLVMVDKLNRTVKSLGHGEQGRWFVNAFIKHGTGDPEAFLGGNITIPFIDGWANFTNLNISHNDTDYILGFKISFPLEANFTAFSEPFEVKERILYFTLVTQPNDANETVPFSKQPVVEVRDAANSELVTNTGWKGRKWICNASLLNPQSYKGNLGGSTSVEFFAGVAKFSDLSIHHEGKNYILNIEAFTVRPSRYQFSKNSEPFEVKERVLALVITQQPGDCNDTVSCGFQPILEIQDTATNTLAGNLGWRGRTWTVNVSMEQGASNNVILGTSRFQIPQSGRAEFKNISFYDVAAGYRMKFEVTVSPHSQTYSGMDAISNVFNVNPRKFYLEVVTQAANANQSEVFGKQPVVEVRDVGTREIATPLKTPWNIAVTLYSNPKPGKSFLNGTFNVSVQNERAAFTDLLITVYGLGYKLMFESNYGHSVVSAPFEVSYVNDYFPVFTSLSDKLVVNISESTSVGFSVIRIKATDKDKGSQGDVYYALSRGNTGNSFTINKTSGVITSAKELDRETTAIYNLVVKAYDGAVPEKVRFTEGHVVVNITDVNDNAPQFAKTVFTASMKETADINDVITRVAALDRDAGSNAVLKFSITSGNAGGFFDINPSTGEILVKKSLDLEGALPPSLNYTMGVHVTDMGVPSLTNSTTVFIIVSPVNEFSPQITHAPSDSVIVKENQDIGAGLVLFDVNATDKDFGPQGRVHYSINSGNDGGKFKVDPSSGVVSLLSPLDYETAARHTLVIRASDSDPSGHALFADFTLNVSVYDVNDNSPTFANPMTVIDVPETLSVGQIATIIQANDSDARENGRVSYSIVSGDPYGYFKLDPNTGELATQKSLDLEIARISNWTLTLVIVAKDHGNPPLSSNATFVMKINSVNEFTPQFTQPGLVLQIAEDAAVGSLLYRVTATDNDFGPDGLVAYQILNGNEDKRFRMNSSSGEIFVHAPLDRETKPTYSLKIEASDSPTNSANRRSSVTFVNVTLMDVNDNKPIFKAGSYYGAVKETEGVGNDVIAVQATDADEALGGQVRYYIKSGNSHGFFRIDSETGTIRVQKSLDLETQEHVDDLLYTLTIEARDRGTPVSLSNDVLVTIEILSVNEFAPKLQHSDHLYVKISEDLAHGSKICDINATDQDFGQDGLLTYSIISGNEGNHFAINSNTGVISVNRELDYETIVRYSLGIRVSDSAPQAQRFSIDAKVTVRLTNVNDSGGVDVIIQEMPSRITPPGDPAKEVGVSTSTPILVVLLYENGTQEKLLAGDNRLTFDDKSESRGLFEIVQTGGKFIIEANRAESLGQGILILRVHNVYNVRVKINVVGYSSLQLTAVPYPYVNQSNSTLASLKRIGSYHGNFQQAAMKLKMILTDNSSHDVSMATAASFSVVSSEIGVKASFGPSPKNVLFVDRKSGSGKLQVCGRFFGKVSKDLELEVSSRLLTVNRLLEVQINGLKNHTLRGLSLSTRAQIQVVFLMNDSSVLGVQNFSAFPGLVNFTTSNPYAAVVGSRSGIVTLVSDYHDFVTVKVTPLQGSAEPKVIQFYCNIDPPIGGVDIGQEFGPALPVLRANQRVKIPVRVNQGRSKLLAYDVKISYNDRQAHLVDLGISTVYSLTKGQLRLADVVNPEDSSSHIADLVFDTLVDGPLNIQASVSMLIDNKLGYIGKSKPTPVHCTEQPLGDITGDCMFDIQDAAYVMAYASAQERNFVDEYGQTLSKRVSSKVLERMDFNFNGMVERNDAFLLARANLGMAAFTRAMHVITPDHRDESTECTLEVTVNLTLREGDMDTSRDMQVFFEFVGEGKALSKQLRNTVFEAGKLVATYDNINNISGGIVKAKNQDGGFQIRAKQSQIERSELGLSMIQVMEDSKWLKPIVTPLFAYSSTPRFSSFLRVNLAPNVDMVVTKGHSPQLGVNITDSYQTCRDPLVFNNVMFTFGNDYADVEGKEESFVENFTEDLIRKYQWIKIQNVRLVPGSILVYFDVITPKSRMSNTLLALWEMIKSGYTLRAGDTVYHSKAIMRLNGQDYHGNDKPSETDGPTKFPMGIVVGVCVTVGVIFIVVIIVFCYRRRSTRGKDQSQWKSLSKVNILDPRSTSRMSVSSWDHEMVPIGAFSNCSYGDVSPSPTPSSPNSPSAYWKGEGEFGVRRQRKIHSVSSQGSAEAWIESGSPTPKRAASPKFKNSSPVGQVLSIHTGNSQDNPSKEDSQSPSALKRPISPLVAQNESNFNSSDSSDDELIRSGKSSPVFTPRLKSKETRPEAFLFDKAVLYKRMNAQGSLSRHSSRSSSAGSSRSGSGLSSPRVNVTPLPPGFVGSGKDGNDITIEDEPFTLRLPVNILNTVKGRQGESAKPFTKIGFVEFSSAALLSELRERLKGTFPDILQRKPFLFQDAQMADVEPSCEETTKTSYNLCVIIKFANAKEAAQLFCPCGAAAHFQCSNCYKRGYCGRECQRKDWLLHKTKCESEEVSAV